MNDREIHVLLIEDNPGDARLVQGMLASPAVQGFAIESTARLSAGLERLREGGIDVVLLDLLLPDSEGVDTYRRAQRSAPGLAIVVLSGTDDSAIALQAVHEGAQDFLIKGQLEGEQLVRALRYAVERKRTQDATNEEKFRVLAQTTKDGIISIDCKGEILFWNHEAERIFEYSATDVLGRPLGMLMPERFRTRCRQGLEEYLLTGQSYFVGNTIELVGCKRDGSEFPMELSLATLGFGGAAFFTGVVRDVSERKRTEESLRELSGRLLLSQEEERRHLARELHDSTAQALASMELHVALLQSLIPAENTRAHESLFELTEEAQRCSREIRTISHLMHPPDLEDTSVGSAIVLYADRFGQRSGIRIVAEAPYDLPRFDTEIETALLRIAQEALANIHRHSGSKTAQIRLTLVDGLLQLEIKDRGRGIPNDLLNSPAKMGVGIRGMKERARLLGGKLTIEADDRGTTVQVELPATRPAKVTTIRTQEKHSAHGQD